MLSFASSGDCEVADEKQSRFLPGMFQNFAHLFAGFPAPGAAAAALRNFPFPASGAPPTLQSQLTSGAMADSSASSSTSSTAGSATSPSTAPNHGNVFPMFPPNMAAYSCFMQNQLLAQLAKNACMNPEAASPPLINESRSSSADKSSVKKLQIDADGNATCPVCLVKLPLDASWDQHVEQEKKNLIQCIEVIRAQKRSHMNGENASISSSATESGPNRSHQKRESELSRIRSNQQKRLAWKSIGPLSARNEHNESSRSTSADKNYCNGCERQHEFLIISEMLDEPRCLDCYRKVRRQTTFLPSTITENPADDASGSKRGSPLLSLAMSHSVDDLLSHLASSRNSTSPSYPRKRPAGASETSSPGIEDKRFKIEC